MNDLYIEQSKSTPLINFNPKTGILKMEGKSFPENAPSFYHPVIGWIEEFIKESDKRIILELEIIYLNTSTTKIIMELFENLSMHFSNGKDIIINWYYDKKDEMSHESGEEFKEDLKVPFNLVEK